MAVQWNKVTWYSKLLAVILFVLTFYIGFCLGSLWGEQKGELKTAVVIPKVTVPEKVTPLSIDSQDIKDTNFTGKIATVSGSGPLASSARDYINKRVGEFRTQANTEVPPMQQKFGAGSPPATYEIDITATDVKSSKTESVVISVYSYTGGANGNSVYKVITASIPGGKILTLAGVIKSAEQNAFTVFLQKKLNDWRPDGTSTTAVFPDEVASLKFSSFTNWSLDDKNLTIYFDQYYIGPGVLGEIAFPLPLAEVKDFLNPEYAPLSS